MPKGKKSLCTTGLVLAIGVSCVATLTHAAPSDCVESGGKVFCGAPFTTEWGYQLCDEAAASLGRSMTWCFARGGTQNGWYAPCIGATEPNESNLRTFSYNFAQRIHSNTCSWNGDTGWGHTSLSTNCWSGPPSYQNNILQRDNRKFSFTCTTGGNETVYELKSRSIACPPGYTNRFDSENNRYCSRPIESTSCPTQTTPNPITVGTGIKTQNEVDIAGSDGLGLTRYHHGFGFYNPSNSVDSQPDLLPVTMPIIRQEVRLQG